MFDVVFRCLSFIGVSRYTRKANKRIASCRFSIARKLTCFARLVLKPKQPDINYKTDSSFYTTYVVLGGLRVCH